MTPTSLGCSSLTERPSHSWPTHCPTCPQLSPDQPFAPPPPPPLLGGPVYVSDRPGVHDFTVLARLVLPDGSVLRCRGHARPTRDSLFADPLRDGRSVLKVRWRGERGSEWGKQGGVAGKVRGKLGGREGWGQQSRVALLLDSDRDVLH